MATVTPLPGLTLETLAKRLGTTRFAVGVILDYWRDRGIAAVDADGYWHLTEHGAVYGMAVLDAVAPLVGVADGGYRRNYLPLSPRAWQELR